MISIHFFAVFHLSFILSIPDYRLLCAFTLVIIVVTIRDESLITDISV